MRNILASFDSNIPDSDLSSNHDSLAILFVKTDTTVLSMTGLTSSIMSKDNVGLP